ncbi:hypothetical protein HLB44_09015 [Aquincola sp. S2]|uniref:Uncharacterized protein n=1 Tax=Pseudaquabacterium terrae TaxID=2732868 RepID=A0ABX2EEU2_9BURK|nr:hypothetical protein [Aquabacterium terrae]NRF67120.1 hypothetical protein [Aquabacterium terrae]
MNTSSMLMTGLAALGGIALVAWIGWAIASVNDDLRGLDGFEGMHLED